MFNESMLGLCRNRNRSVSVKFICGNKHFSWSFQTLWLTTAIFFIEYLVCTYTYYSHAINFYYWIPYGGKHLRGELFPKLNSIPPGSLTLSGQIKVIFHFSRDVNIHNCCIWATSNLCEYTLKPLYSPNVTVVWIHKFVYHKILLFFKHSA